MKGGLWDHLAVSLSVYAFVSHLSLYPPLILLWGLWDHIVIFFVILWSQSMKRWRWNWFCQSTQWGWWRSEIIPRKKMRKHYLQVCILQSNRNYDFYAEIKLVCMCWIYSRHNHSWLYRPNSMLILRLRQILSITYLSEVVKLGVSFQFWSRYRP
jgi:hypothetical protein